jgi:hypothetical protein
MISYSSKFMEKLRAGAPAPHDETEEYKKFSHYFALVSMLIYIISAYAASLLFANQMMGLTAALSNIFPVLDLRINFLGLIDTKSATTYVATITSGTALLSVSMILNFIGYWRTVASKGRCFPVNNFTIINMIMSILIMTTLLYTIFVLVPNTFDPRWPGMIGLLFWPMFPAIGALTLFLCSSLAFSVFVGFLKLVKKAARNV